jgi:hypothetical protein
VDSCDCAGASDESPNVATNGFSKRLGKWAELCHGEVATDLLSG